MNSDDCTRFEHATKSCKLRSPTLDIPAAVPTSNNFDVLSSVPPPPPASVSPPTPGLLPKMVFRQRVPPISIKLTSDTILSLVQSILRPDTHILYLRDRIRVHASSPEFD